MTTTVEILRQYNRWRRGDDTLPQPDTEQIGKAIDSVCDEIERLTEALRIAVAAFETQTKAAHEAAELLRDEAAILRDCSTVSGEWDADDREVLAAFNRMMELAHRLEVNLSAGLGGTRQDNRR